MENQKKKDAYNCFLYENLAESDFHYAIAQIKREPMIKIYNKDQEFPVDYKLDQPEPVFTITSEDMGEADTITILKFVEIHQQSKLFVATNFRLLIICPVTGEVQTLDRNDEERFFIGVGFRNDSIYYGDIEGSVKKITFITEPMITPVYQSDMPITSLEVTDDHVFIAIDDGSVLVLDAKTENLIKGVEGPIWSVYITCMRSVKGTGFIVMGMSNGTISILDSNNLQDVILANYHSKEITSISCRNQENGTIAIFSGSEDGVISIGEYDYNPNKKRFKCLMSQNPFNKIPLGVYYSSELLLAVFYNSDGIVRIPLA